MILAVLTRIEADDGAVADEEYDTTTSLTRDVGGNEGFDG